MTVDKGISVHLLLWESNILKIMKNFAIGVALSTCFSASCYAIDPFVVGLRGNGKYGWRIQFAQADSDAYPFSTSVGVITPLLGYWQGEEGLSVATIDRGVDGSVILKHPSKIAGIEIGLGYYVLAGGDFDGTLRSGIALAQRSKFGSSISWRVVNDPLNSFSVYNVPGLGRSGDLPFYFRGGQGRDLLSVLRGSSNGTYRQVLAADVISGQRLVIRLSDPVRAVVKVSGIRLPDGAGGIFIQTQDDYRIYSAKGQMLVWGNSSQYSRNAVVVGDYFSDKGDEIAVLNSDEGQVAVLNPFSVSDRVVRVGSGDVLHDQATALVVNHLW